MTDELLFILRNEGFTNEEKVLLSKQLLEESKGQKEKTPEERVKESQQRYDSMTNEERQNNIKEESRLQAQKAKAVKEEIERKQEIFKKKLSLDKIFKEKVEKLKSLNNPVITKELELKEELIRDYKDMNLEMDYEEYVNREYRKYFREDAIKKVQEEIVVRTGEENDPTPLQEPVPNGEPNEGDPAEKLKQDNNPTPLPGPVPNGEPNEGDQTEKSDDSEIPEKDNNPTPAPEPVPNGEPKEAVSKITAAKQKILEILRAKAVKVLQYLASKIEKLNANIQQGNIERQDIGVTQEELSKQYQEMENDDHNIFDAAGKDDGQDSISHSELADENREVTGVQPGSDQGVATQKVFEKYEKGDRT